ncbi:MULTISPECIES: hypothetical protein [unclassified Gordonia (in: high G+C Gram-positive bacteria)]|uniref:hypothetical protein n=1 Tax=unclassified Gordonia (in: high G+C Gram-positive bacteria) TaxID=2657482 RepID=UPI001965C865|nr:MULTISPECIES: hypothetical protein [unclassified Gordonia (in: high G+C Gram-positive bacteria)]MBN0974174.1 hypothetical protein [Gordonia sp. BP-119]MBN0983942.1 hypothetical protein [Gordonia sp. BP-94]
MLTRSGIRAGVAGAALSLAVATGGAILTGPPAQAARIADECTLEFADVALGGSGRTLPDSRPIDAAIIWSGAVWESTAPPIS